MKKEMYEQDLKILDIFQTTNGNLFLKVTDYYSLPLGSYEYLMTGGCVLDKQGLIPISTRFKVTKVGKVKFNKHLKLK